MSDPTAVVVQDLEALLAKHGLASTEDAAALLALTASYLSASAKRRAKEDVLSLERRLFRDMVSDVLSWHGGDDLTTDQIRTKMETRMWAIDMGSELRAMCAEGIVQSGTRNGWVTWSAAKAPAPALWPSVTQQPTTATDTPARPLTKKVLGLLDRTPRSTSSLHASIGGSIRSIQYEIHALLWERLIEPVFPLRDHLSERDIAYRVTGSADARIAALEAENATLRRLAADNAKLFESEAWKAKGLASDLKQAHEAESRARKDARDNQEVANAARRDAALYEQRGKEFERLVALDEAIRRRGAER